MKKIIIALLALLTLALTVAPVALAETECETNICEMAKQNEKVKDAKCVVYNRTAVVAIRTEKFSTRSQYDVFVKQLTEQIRSECEVDHVFVTRNPKIMKQIEGLAKLDENERDEAIEKLIEDVMRFRPIRKMDIPKITIGR